MTGVGLLTGVIESPRMDVALAIQVSATVMKPGHHVAAFSRAAVSLAAAASNILSCSWVRRRAVMVLHCH